ncbi:endolytic transglycosylase MltG [Paramaledivibacter caminithermalis]|uniref:Endolytic murein transglycosylase n=1 Tax=Paramaledivibacter caminithermalis (strain DSM 15212 / CIP 107654 / DViRD3) TaxID=1121301 RepID=A0A1M6JSG0_PARC5|nr:endolytic transglycosylase MltG [Paramaledivibacter caminithermalis]SHJ49628.1 UPF0755 protein [Paramaledivibacter caminithermalis DSM 15212]
MKTSTKKTRRIIGKIRMSLLIFLIICAYSGYQYFISLGFPVDKNSTDNILINIPKGASSSKIASILKDKNVIKNELYFKFISKQRKIGGKYQAGEYELNKAMNIDEIINKLIKGDIYVEAVKITIPEGFELKQIVDRLVNNDELNINREQLIDIIENKDFEFKFLKEIPKGKNRLEGFLFPDTYLFKKDISEEEIVFKMLNRFDEIFQNEYYKRAKELDMSIKDVITLASIIEREARVDKERKIISSVFHNRLKKDMLLQSCATVQYILGERKQNLTYQDLEIDSQYNTYIYKGLPPKPIASPGKASIEAALYPDDTSYLYFVAKGDGSHVFSRTYSEHLKAKNNN